MYLQHAAWNGMGLCWYRAEMGENHLDPVADPSTKTLLAIIKLCIFPGTKSVSDCGDVQHSSGQ
jgi:hypothetical protein